jgi:hypothetical protein
MIRQWFCAVALLALTLSLGAAPPAGTSVAVRPFSALTADERAHLPAATRVVVRKRTTTLGILRAEHIRRRGRVAVANAVTINWRSILQKSSLANASIGLANPTGTLVVEPASAYSGDVYGSYSTDVQTFCKTAHATLCLYYPAQTTFWLNQGTHDSEDNDPFITDAGICASGGGLFIGGNCDYIYPAEHISQFNPGTGAPFTYKADCDANYWTLTVDPHGAIAAKAGPKPLSSWNWSTGANPVWCVVSAYLQP